MPKQVDSHDQIAQQLSPYLRDKIAQHQIMTLISQQLLNFMQTHLNNLGPDLSPKQVDADFIAGNDNPTIQPLINQIQAQLEPYRTAILTQDQTAYTKRVAQLGTVLNQDILQCYLQSADITPIDIQVDDLVNLLKNPIDDLAIDAWFDPFKDRETITLLGDIINEIYQFEQDLNALLGQSINLGN